MTISIIDPKDVIGERRKREEEKRKRIEDRKLGRYWYNGSSRRK